MDTTFSLNIHIAYPLPNTVEPPLTVTSDERSPPINGHFHSPRGVFLYILPLINGHLPPPVSGHNNL